MSTAMQMAIYARVSSEQQVKERTIASQVAELKERVAHDGGMLAEAFCFLDEGYSGSTLMRPALERLRDQMHAGLIDRLYVHSPDRLARRYAYQVVLLDECKRQGVAVVFLNRDTGVSPEDDLLVQVQGVIAEYERAKIMERSRRGRLHAARRGAVEALHGAPYGYHYRRRAADQPAAYLVNEAEAVVVRQIFHWVAVERLTLGAVRRRLLAANIPSPQGKQQWERSTLAHLLRNPAYQGKAAFGRTRIGERRPRLRPMRGQPETPRRSYSIYRTDAAEHIAIAVPALVTAELFAAVGEQLEESRKRHRQRAHATSLLQGLVVCPHCGKAFSSRTVRSVYKGKSTHYHYYRCTGTDACANAGERLCDNRQVRKERLEETLWHDVCELLSDPVRLKQEYQRRCLGISTGSSRELQQTQARLHQARQGRARLIDAYEAGLLEKTEFETRILNTRQRVKQLEQETRTLSEQAAAFQQVQDVLKRWQEFADHIDANLHKADWDTRRQIIVALVKRIEVGKEEINIVYKVPAIQEITPRFVHDCPRILHQPFRFFQPRICVSCAEVFGFQ